MVAQVIRAATATGIFASSGGGTTPDNPDGFPAATQTYYSADFEDSVNDVPFMLNASSDCLNLTYRSGGGLSGTNCWRAIPKQNSQTPTGGGENTWEGGMGWKFGPNSLPIDSCYLYVVSYMLRMSSLFCAHVGTQSNNYGINKAVTMHMWAENGSGADGNTRQIIQMLGYRDGFFYPPSDSDGIYLAHVSGGAGDRYTYDGVNTPYNYMATPDEFLFVRHVFDARLSQIGNRGTYTYVKRSGQAMRRSLFRREGVNVFTPPYQYTTRGWYTPHPSDVLWGYWGDIKPASAGGYDYNVNRYIEIDQIRVTNGWTDPPDTWPA